ncbi:hypothetical protein BDV95DRAFT_595601 [Massariosphaeria phaeospora]|uniref:Uncharacterized protein n=1 Tax=Massariosphaeria phaeospora TaxID=100035 RepID=A0A7C8I3L9_9PLEO|nr:hypothetical protein BDV95DRAFT_595601 [Massariosphaeria phaeospora]
MSLAYYIFCATQSAAKSRYGDIDMEDSPAHTVSQPLGSTTQSSAEFQDGDIEMENSLAHTISQPRSSTNESSARDDDAEMQDTSAHTVSKPRSPAQTKVAKKRTPGPKTIITKGRKAKISPKTSPAPTKVAKKRTPRPKTIIAKGRKVKISPKTQIITSPSEIAALQKHVDQEVACAPGPMQVVSEKEAEADTLREKARQFRALFDIFRDEPGYSLFDDERNIGFVTDKLRDMLDDFDRRDFNDRAEIRIAECWQLGYMRECHGFLEINAVKPEQKVLKRIVGSIVRLLEKARGMAMRLDRMPVLGSLVPFVAAH